MMRNASSFLCSTWEKNWEAALRSTPIRLTWLPLVSTSIPIVSGRSVSRVKYLIVCGLPSSRIVKSFFSRLGIRVPCLSRTDASTFTTSTSTLIDGRSSSGGFCCCAGSGARAAIRVRNIAVRMPVE